MILQYSIQRDLFFYHRSHFRPEGTQMAKKKKGGFTYRWKRKAKPKKKKKKG